MFALLRQLERWLHQHIFKVGWLVTKSFQTTTILYYTFFLPGVFLHELSYWFAAGVLNVHAKGSIKWPEAQEIAELDLSFVELARNVSPFRLALITLAPILTGLASVWFIANNILEFNAFFSLIRTGTLADITAAFQRLTSAADFWLWIYLLFTISNTMISRLQDLRGLRIVLIVTGVVAVMLIFIGVGNEVVLRALAGPVSDALYLLAGTFTIIILIDLLFVIGLGTIEAVIERITGDSAMFRRGKLVAMTRREMLEQRQRESRRQARALQARTATKETRKVSIYDFPLAIPGPPGEEPVTQSETVIVEMEEKPALVQGARQDTRRGPDMITGAATSRPPTPALSAPGDAATPADEGLDVSDTAPTSAESNATPEGVQAELASSAEREITEADSADDDDQQEPVRQDADSEH